MRVLILAPSKLPIPNVKGGAIETLTTYILDENEKSSSPIEFLVLCNEDSDASEASKRYKHSGFLFYKEDILISIYVFIWRVLRKLFPYYVYVHLGILHKFKKEIRAFSPDCVLLEGDYYQINHAKKLRKPVIVHLHTDLINKDTPHVQRIISEKPIYWVISQFLKRRIEEVGGNKIDVFKNCIDTDLYTRKANIDVRWELGIPMNEKVLMYCGRVVPIKGVKELIYAFHKAHEDNLSLLIVGGSNFADSKQSQYVQELQDYVKNNNLNVRFTGYVDPSLLPAYYQAADYFAYPSICNEAAGLGIIEATCSGLSVITTKMGGIPEYIAQDRTIFVENDKDIINNIAKAIHIQCDSMKYKKLDSSMVSSYITEHNLKTYYSVFCKLINKAVR